MEKKQIETSYDVSILVPIYNVSAYIEKCAISLFEQTYQNIEYIFVNDCTPDDSVEKLKKVIERYPNREKDITILENEINRGLAYTRKRALSRALGQYILVIDSDDYIELNTIEEMYNATNNGLVDIVYSNLYLEYENRRLYIEDSISEITSDRLHHFFTSKNARGYLVNKLIRRELYLDPLCEVPDGLDYLEDRYVTTFLICLAKRIAYIDKAFYHYIQYNSNAITKSKGRKHFENMVLCWSELDKNIKNGTLPYVDSCILEKAKVNHKAQLILDTFRSKAWREYSDLFYDFELNYLNELRFGERLVLLAVHYKMFKIADFLMWLIYLKNKKNSVWNLCL